MSAGRSRVLVVDDDGDCREIVSEALRFEGYEVRAAADGREALAVIGDWRPELILLDVLMSELDGRAFREEQLGNGFADIPVLVLTAADRPQRYAQVLAAPVLPKPFELDALLAEVRRLLS
jgi:two-component system OmpR family response regulator